MRIMLMNVTWLSLVATARAADFALIIGVNHCPQFRLPDGSKPRSLRGAETDANSVAELLVKTYRFDRDHVTLLKGEQATKAELGAAFVKLQKQLKPTDRLVFHFSGHGTQVDDQQPFDEDDNLDEALCLYDSESSGRNLLLDDELGRWLDDIAASAVTILLDCCHAGTGHKELDDDIQSRFLPCRITDAVRNKDAPWGDLQSQQKTFGRQTAAFFACRAEQQAYERPLSAGQNEPPVRAGQFTYFLRRGLESGQADLNVDGQITQEEVRNYVERELKDSFNARRPLAADQQQPVLDSARPDGAMFFVGVR